MLLGGAFASADAQTTSSINVVTTAVPFLRISPDARAGGMGELGIATSPDANSNYWNIAKTPFNTNKGGIAVSYTPWLKDLGLNDVYFMSLAGYYKLDDMQALSASVRYFSLGNIQFTDGSGNALNTFRPREFAIDLGYSRKLSKKFSMGIAVRYISSDLAGNVPATGTIYKKGSSVAGDIHLFHTGAKENGQGFNWGVALSNLGSKIAYTNDATQKDYIPANFGVGVSYTKVFDAENKLSFGLDLNKLMVPTPPTGAEIALDPNALTAYRTKGVVNSWFSSFGDAPTGGEELREVSASIGAEYMYKNQFGFRAGYFYEHQDKGGRKYFTLGASLKYNIVGLDLSYVLPTGSGVNRNPLSNTLRFGLKFDIKGK